MKPEIKKVVIITGATSGIGLATAKLFLKKGYKVYGIARKPYSGDDFTCFEANVTDYTAINGVLREIYEREKRIDIFINNAGFGIAGAVEDTDEQKFQQIIEVNLTAVCALCGKAVAYLKETRGKIINVSSVGGIMPLPYQAAYSATKAGVEVFSRALANEVKPYGIKVCAVMPGDTKTGFTDSRICEGDNASAKSAVAKMARDEKNGKSPESVARVIYKTARKKNPPLRVSTGFASKLEVFLARFLPVKALNGIIGKIYK